MPRDEFGQKWACVPCIRGHRTAKCEHWDRWMVRVKRPGRPLTRCPHPERDGCECVEEHVMMVEMRRLEDGTALCEPKKTKKILPTAEEAPSYDPRTGDLLTSQSEQSQTPSLPSLQSSGSMSQFSSPSSVPLQQPPYTNGTNPYVNGNGLGHQHILPSPSSSQPYPYLAQDMVPIQVAGCDHDSHVHGFTAFDHHWADHQMPMLPPMSHCHAHHGNVLAPAPFNIGMNPNHLHQHLYEDGLQTEGGRDYSPEFNTPQSTDDKCAREFCPRHPNNNETRARVGELVSHMSPQDFQAFAAHDLGSTSISAYPGAPSPPKFSEFPASAEYPATRPPAFSQEPNSTFTYLVQFNDPCSKDSCNCGDRCRCPDCAVHNPRPAMPTTTS